MPDYNKLYDKDEEEAALREYAAKLPIDFNASPEQAPGYTHLPVEMPSKPEQFVQILTGGAGQERYQTWPEKMVRSALTLPTDVMSGKEQMFDPDTGHISENVISRSQDMAGLAFPGTLAMKPGTASLTTGMKKMNRKAKDLDGNEITDYNGNPIKLGDDGKLTLYHRTDEGSRKQIYETGNFKSKENTNETFFSDNLESEYGKGFGEHVVAVKVDPKYVRLNDQFPNGENHYAISNKYLSKSNLFSDTSTGTGIAAVRNAPTFFSSVEQAVKNAKMNTGTAEQWQGYLKNQPGVKAEELQWTGLDSLPKGQLTKEFVEKHVADNGVKLEEVWKGKGKLNVVANENEPHILEVYRADDPTGTVSGMVGEIIKKDNKNGEGKYQINVPELEKRWFNTQKEAEDYISKNTDIGMNTRHHQWQLPGGENYREMVVTLPDRSIVLKNRRTEINKRLDDIQNEMNDLYLKGDEKSLIKRKEIAKEEQYLVAEYNKMPENLNSVNFTAPGHWGDLKNPLYHVRMNDRNIPVPSETIGQIVKRVTGKDWNNFSSEEQMKFLNKNWLKTNELKQAPLKSLHIEEIQSDWHQKGRKEGYKLSKEQKDKLEPEFNRIDDKIINSGDEAIMGHPDIREAVKMAVDKKIITQAEGDLYKRYADSERIGAVPDAPFKSNWSDVAIKRMIREASEKGYDAISWTPGEAQTSGQALKKEINSIDWHNKKMGKIDPTGAKQILIDTKHGDEITLTINKNGTIIEGGKALNLYGKNLDETFGKGVSEKILNNNEGNLKGEGLIIGLEGMKGFYDKMVVDKVNAIAKKFGGKVEQVNLNKGTGGSWDKITENSKQSVHILKFTPELKKHAIEKGFPLFEGAPILTPVQGNPFEDKNLNKLDKERPKVKLIPVAHIPDFL